jgi:hypothetical protein
MFSLAWCCTISTLPDPLDPAMAMHQCTLALSEIAPPLESCTDSFTRCCCPPPRRFLFTQVTFIYGVTLVELVALLLPFLLLNRVTVRGLA